MPGLGSRGHPVPLGVLSSHMGNSVHFSGHEGMSWHGSLALQTCGCPRCKLFIILGEINGIFILWSGELKDN